jgi:NAD(P)H dehydrogenase (quinone)
MSEQVKVAVVYYSSTGTVYQLAKSIVEGAEKAGAEVRLRKVHELAPDEAIAATRAGQATRPRRSTSPKPLPRTSSGPTR